MKLYQKIPDLHPKSGGQNEIIMAETLQRNPMTAGKRAGKPGSLIRGDNLIPAPVQNQRGEV